MKKLVRFHLFESRWVLLLLFISLVIVCTPSSKSPVKAQTDVSPAINLDSVLVEGLTNPVGFYTPGDGTGRFFIVEQGGTIRIFKNGQLLSTPFLSLDPQNEVVAGGERGLLGLAFHPNFSSNGFFFVNFTRQPDGATVIARYKVSSNPDVADTTSRADILVIGQPYANHNGGHIAFGPDGYLYIGMGDGGSGGDPQNNAQNLNSLLGKMLRIQPNTTTPAGYSNPVGNIRSEIWALGLRNPWFWSFDRATGDLYIGDVGQNAWEEVNFRRFNDPPGANFGWSCLEGNHNYNLNRFPCNDEDFVAATVRPVAEYSHNEGFSITGGFVYRGSQYPNLVGRYFYTDYSTGTLWSIKQTSTQPVIFSPPEQHLDVDYFISCFGEDDAGELYVCDHFFGKIRRLQDASSTPPDLTGSTFSASTPYANQSEEVTFTVHLVNTGGLSQNPVSVQITVPSGLTYKPGSLTLPGSNDNAAPVLTWQGVLTPNVPVDISYVAVVNIGEGNPITQALVSGSGYSSLTLKHALLIPRPVLGTTAEDFFMPGTQPLSLTNPVLLPSSCDVCHSEIIMEPWQGSMMAQSGRDPLFWAALEVANHDAPGSGEFCLRCHTPKGWLEGRSSAADGSALRTIDFDAGVTCEICHRAVSPFASPGDQSASRDTILRNAVNPGLPADHTGSGMLILDPEDFRRGPFDLGLNFAYHPNQTFRTDFLGGTPNNYIARSSLCGTCHNVDNPVFTCSNLSDPTVPCQLNAVDTAAPSLGQDQLFAVETTYEEWLNSSYVNSAACQDCHMPASTGYAAEPFFNPVLRDCGLNGCLPLHDLAGGNTWAPILLQRLGWRLNRNDLSGLLNTAANKARQMLQSAAEVTVSPLTPSGTPGFNQTTVRVTNLTGHKLPTGYAEGRRMWLSVRAFAVDGTEVFTSCQYATSTGILSLTNNCQVFEIKQGISPDLAATLNMPAGESFHFMLNNMVVKDNRIPPAGFTSQALNRRSLASVPAGLYQPGQNYAEFLITSIPDSAVQITASLYYQTASKEYIDFLEENGGLDAQTLKQLWTNSKSPPELMAWDSEPFRTYFMPTIYR